MMEKLDIYGTDWKAFDERYRYLEEARDTRDLSPEEKKELIEMDEQFIFLGKDYKNKKGTSEQEYHPGNLFFARCEKTSSNINACLDAGQPMSFPHSDQSPLIITNPHWEENMDRAFQR